MREVYTKGVEFESKSWQLVGNEKEQGGSRNGDRPLR